MINLLWQKHEPISWLSQFSHFLDLFLTESLILLRFLALEIWWNIFLMATCLDILSHSCSFPYNSVLLSLFWLQFHCIHSPSLFCLSANRSQEPLREFCEHLIISIFSCTSERYCRIWQLKEEQLLKCNKMYLKLSSLLKVIERFA